ncbi:MAG TPA: radical SAM protein, partial [Gemmatimonadaceae bacterium]|nr:radical SAM protein [Gemmatimonadaceae bacterium]
CAVTSEAEAELRKVVRHAARQRPALRSVVMGCAAALDDSRPPALRIASLPTVDRVVAGADLPALASALDLSATTPILTRGQSGTRALLRIQDGCDEHCTFCATTLARGANRSRPARELVDEARALAERHPEIVITGIHIGTYGADIGSSLGELMQRLVRDVPRARFRLSSIEATEIDDALFDLLVNAPAMLCPHVHAPLQSGSDTVLKRMGRHWYTSSSYASAVERLAVHMPALGLGADVITGFPGEADTDHAATTRLVESLPFTYLHVFPYSLRPGTPAERLPGRVQPSIATRRAAELRSLAARKSAEYQLRRAGGQADVVVIGRGAEREGMTGDYLTVELEPRAFEPGARFVGRLQTSPGGGLQAILDE